MTGLGKVFQRNGSRGDYCLVLLWVQNDFGLFKSFWLCTNHFGRVQFVLDKSKLLKNSPENYFDSSKRSIFGCEPILLDRSNLFWASPNYKKNSPENYLVIRTVQIWICTNPFGRVQFVFGQVQIIEK